MHGTGVVVILDGPALVGRSTTLAGLQAAWPAIRSGPLLGAGLDAMLAGFGPVRPRWQELVGPQRTGARPGGDDQPLTWGPLGRELLSGLHRSAAAWAHAGFDVAVDHDVIDRATLADLADAFDGLVTVHVLLTCDQDVLDARAEELGHATEVVAHRPPPAVRSPHVLLDTTSASTEELVAPILELVVARTAGEPRS